MLICPQCQQAYSPLKAHNCPGSPEEARRQHIERETRREIREEERKEEIRDMILDVVEKGEIDAFVNFLYKLDRARSGSEGVVVNSSFVTGE